MEKLKTGIGYISACILGLVTIVTLCCPCIIVSVNLSDGNVQQLKYDAFKFMASFSGVKGAGAGIFNGVISVFMLVIGAILLCYALFLTLEHFGVLHLEKFKKVKKASRILKPLCVSQLVLSLMSLVLLACCANKLTEISDFAVYTLGAGTVVLFIFAILSVIVPSIFASEKKFCFKKFKIKRPDLKKIFSKGGKKVEKQNAGESGVAVTVAAHKADDADVSPDLTQSGEVA